MLELLIISLENTITENVICILVRALDEINQWAEEV